MKRTGLPHMDLFPSDNAAAPVPAQNRILIIDDDPSVCHGLAGYFEDRGFRVFTAEDGQSGLDIFFSQDIELVLTDLRLPKTDGIDVMKAIQDHRDDVPIIVLSGAGEKTDIIKTLQMGAKDYIAKPVTDLDILGQAVEKALEIRRLSLENKRYRLQLEKSEKKYRTITENIAEGVFTLDRNKTFLYANQAFCQMVGSARHDIPGSRLSDMVLPDSLKALNDQIHHLKTETTRRFETQLLHTSGRQLHVELACTSMLDNAQTHQGLIAVVRDITDTVRLREKYKHFLHHTDARSNNVVPICASCKNIRIRKGEWQAIEAYFSTIAFSHGICPDCCEKLYPELDLSDPVTGTSES